MGENFGASRLLCACQKGRYDEVKLLLECGEDVNTSGYNDNTVLIEASMNGHYDVVRLLLENGAEVNLPAPDGNTALIQASVLGYTDIVRVLLNFNADVNSTEYNSGCSSLVFASQDGHCDVVKVLLEWGANVNLATKSGWSALILASQNGHYDIVKILLEKDAERNAAHHDSGGTALIMATQNDHCHVVRILLENGADMNMATAMGRTALTIASSLGNTDIVETLLKFKAAVNLTESTGWSSLTLASLSGHTNVVKLLLENGADVNSAIRDKGVTALRIASQNGHQDVVRLLLNRGAKVNLSGLDKVTALISASHSGHYNIVKALLEKGAEVNTAVIDGRTALCHASSLGHIDTARLLLHFNAEIDTTDNFGRSSLIIAASSGHCQIVELLLQKGAQVNLPTYVGLTALISASQNGHYGVVRLLLEKGAEVDSVTYDAGCSALTLASQNGHCDVVRLLLEKGAKANLIASEDSGKNMTALLQASANGHCDIVRVLLETGADVNAAYQNGRTSLMLASLNGYTETVRILLDFNAAINATSQDGKNSLLWASQKGHCDVVRLLLKRGADLEFATRDFGFTALTQASGFGHCEVVKLLLENGADVNVATKKKFGSQTALILASSNGHLDVVRVLLKGGADVNLVSREVGFSALMAACQYGFDHIVRMLLEWGADVNAALHKSGINVLIKTCSVGHMDIAKLLLSRGADANAVTYLGDTAIMHASQTGHYDMVRLLLDRGANVNIVTPKTGRTALIQASQNGHCDVVRLLLERGADVNLVTYDSGTTALIQACQAGHYDVIQVLLDWAADVNLAPCSSGATALILASKNGHVDAVRLLLETGAEVNAVSHNGVSALTAASQYGWDNVARLLLEKGADVNITWSGGSALIQACYFGHYDFVKVLLKTGVEVNFATHLSGTTALIQASEQGHLNVVNLLLEHGADVNASHINGTALTEASQHGHTEVVRLLLAFGADVNISNEVRETALTRSAGNGHWDIVKLVVQSGGNLCQTNSKGETPIMYMAFAEASCITDIQLRKKRTKIIEQAILQESDNAMSVASFALVGALIHDTPMDIDIGHMFEDASHCNIALYTFLPQCLHQYGRESKCLLTPYQGVEGKISLHTLCTAVLCKQSSFTLKWLTAKYRDHLVNMLGQSPLHLLAMENHFLGDVHETVRYLTEKLGFSFSEKDNNGRLPYHIACMWLNSQFLLCALSLDHNFETNMLARDHLGNKPLQYMGNVLAFEPNPNDIPLLRVLCARKVLVLLSQLLGQGVPSTVREHKTPRIAYRDAISPVEKYFHDNMSADQLSRLKHNIRDHSPNEDEFYHELSVGDIAVLFKDTRKGIANMKQKEHVVLAITEILYLVGAEMGKTDSLFECVPHLKGSVQEYTKCGELDEIDTSMLLVNFSDYFYTDIRNSYLSLSGPVAPASQRYWKYGNPELLSSVTFCSDFWQLFMNALDSASVREYLSLSRVIIENLKRKHGFVGILTVSFQEGDSIKFLTVDIAPSIVSGNFDGYTALLRPRHHANKQIGADLQRGFELSSSHKDWDFLKFLPSEVICGYSVVKMMRSFGTTFQTGTGHVYTSEELLPSYMIKMALLWVLDPENKFEKVYQSLKKDEILGKESVYSYHDIHGLSEHLLSDILGCGKRTDIEHDDIKTLLDISECFETGWGKSNMRERILPYVLTTKCPGRRVQNGIDLESMAENSQNIQATQEITEENEFIYSRKFYTEDVKDQHKHKDDKNLRPMSHHSICYPEISEETAKKCLPWTRRIFRLLPYLLRYSTLWEGEILTGVRNYYLPGQEVYSRNKDLAIALCEVLEALLYADD